MSKSHHIHCYGGQIVCARCQRMWGRILAVVSQLAAAVGIP